MTVAALSAAEKNLGTVLEIGINNVTRNKH